METQRFINNRRILYLIIFSVFLVNFINIPNLFYYGSDIWVHTAVINELSENPLSSQDYFYAAENQDHRYGPYLLILGIIKKTFDLDIFLVVFLASITNLLIFLVGVYYFTREYFNDKIISIYILPIMIFFWGIGMGHSNEYSFNILVRAASYPSIFAFSCSLIVFCFILNYIRTGNLFYYVISIPIGIIIFLSHPFTGSFLFLTVMVMVLSENTDIRHKSLLFMYPVFVLLIALFWPYYSWYDVVFTPVSGTVFDSEGSSQVPVFYSLSGLLRLGLVLVVGSVILFSLFINKKYNKKYKFIFYGSLLFIIIYITFGIFTVTYGGRYLYFYIFFLHMAIAAEFRERDLFSLNKFKKMLIDINSIWKFASYKKKYILNIILLGIFFLSIIMQIGWTYAPNFVDKQDGKLNFHGYVSYVDFNFNEYKFLEHEVPHYDIVLSDPQTSWVIPTYGGKVVYANSRDTLFKEFLSKNESELRKQTSGRFMDVVFFFKANTTNELRESIFNKYNVSYVLINRNLNLFDERTINEIENMGDITYNNEYFTLVRVR